MKIDDDMIKKFEEQYGHICPNPFNYPKSFKYYWELFIRGNKGTELEKVEQND